MNNRRKKQKQVKAIRSSNKSTSIEAEQSFPFGLWIWYTNEEQHLWSETLYTMMGIEPDIRPTFQLWVELVHGDDLLLFINIMQKLLNNSKPRSFIFRIVRPDKTIRKIKCFAEVISDEWVDIYDISGICMDITDSDIITETTQYKQELQEQTIFQHKLFSLIVHDLKNLFNSAKGFSELLLMRLQKYDKNQIAKYVNNIHSSTCNAYAILESLLQWAAIHQEGWKILLVETELNELINEVIEQLQSAAFLKQIKIIKQIPCNLKALTDAEALKIILRNLLSNAIKYSYHNSEVSILAEQDQEIIKFSVADNGIGMNKKEAEQVFNSSINIPKTGTDKEKGAGIGLSICNELVEKLGGRLWVESEKDKGTLVMFGLPVC